MRHLLPALAAVLVPAALAGCAATGPAAAPRPTLQQEVEAALRGFEGTAGVYVEHLGTGERAAVNADTLFPTASLIKVPILVGTFEALRAGRLRYDQPLRFRDSLRIAGSGVAQYFRDSTETDVNTAVWLMMAASDNATSVWLERLVTADSVNAWLARRGFVHTRMNRRVRGREAAVARYGWGQTTPREMARLATLLRRGQAVGPAEDAEMYRTMTRTFWNDGMLSQLPPTVQAATKQGMVNQTRGEVAVVNAPSGDYVVCLITKDQRDQRWVRDNAGDVLLRRVSALLWRRFEPAHPYTPPAGAY